MSATWDQLYPSNFFRASDVETGPITLTIKGIGQQPMQDGKTKPCASFLEDSRNLVLNRTNAAMLRALSGGSNSPADAVGMRIMLVAVESEYAGKPCLALRIRKPPADGTTAPVIQPKPKPVKRGKAGTDNIEDTY
jgi:hypothetical protein